MRSSIFRWMPFSVIFSQLVGVMENIFKFFKTFQSRNNFTNLAVQSNTFFDAFPSTD